MPRVTSNMRSVAMGQYSGVPLSHNVVPGVYRAYRAVTLAATVIVLCCALVVGHATNVTATNFMVNLVNTVIGIGGRDDPLSANIPAKLNGTVVPDGYNYDAIHYPASIELSKSTNVSAPLVYDAISGLSTGQIIVAGYSEGTLAAEKVKRQLAVSDSAPDASRLSFLEVASPFAANGGIFARFPGISVAFIVNNMGAAHATKYDTTYVINEYDPYADFPAYFNPIALANTLLGVWYAHPDVNYDSVVPGTTPAVTTTVTNSAGGTDTYVFVYNRNLPLLAPLRDLAAITRLTPLVKPVLDAIQPLLEVAINMAYTDRENKNPTAFTPFSLFTPIPKVIEALTQIPGALGQGLKNFVTDIKAEIKALQKQLTALATKLKALAATPNKTTGTATTVGAAAGASSTVAVTSASSVTAGPDVTSATTPKVKRDKMKKKDRVSADSDTPKHRSGKSTPDTDTAAVTDTAATTDTAKTPGRKGPGHRPAADSTSDNTTPATKPATASPAGKTSADRTTPRRPAKTAHPAGKSVGHNTSAKAAA